MLNQLIKAGVFLRLFIWLKPRLKSLLITIAIVAITWLMHGEFLSYAQHSGNAGFLGVSFIIKWIITIMTVFGYLIYQTKQVKREEFSIESKNKQHDTRSGNDGFDFLRKKEKLESRADKIIIQDEMDEGGDL
jgi:hypothetical protein